MTDLNSLGFKKNTNDEVKHKSIYDEIESMVGKTEADLLRAEDSHSNSEHLEIPEMPYIQENPLDKTNQELDSLHSTIKEESSKNSSSATIWNKKMFLISIFALFISISALIVSAVFSILAFNSSNESSSKLEALIIEQNELLKAKIEAEIIVK